MHARREVREGQEVAVVLRQLLDLALRDRGPDLSPFERADARAGDENAGVPAVGLIRRGGRRRGEIVEIEHCVLGHVERELVGLANTIGRRDLKPVSAGTQRGEVVAAVPFDVDRAANARVDFDRRDLRGAHHIAAQRCVRFLRLSGRGERDTEGGSRGSKRQGGSQPASGERAILRSAQHHHFLPCDNGGNKALPMQSAGCTPVDSTVTTHL